MQTEISDAIAPVLSVFQALGIDYYIGGSVASSAYGVARSTLDIDVVANITLSQASEFVKRTAHQYYIDLDTVKEAIQRRSSFNMISLQSFIKIDIFILKSSEYDRTAFSRRKRIDNIEWCSMEDIILNKLLWFKMGGEVSDRQWNDIIGMLQIGWKEVDQEYIKKWSDEIGVKSLLEKVLKDYESP